MWNRLRRAASKKHVRTPIRLIMEVLEDRAVPAAFTAGNLVIYRVGDGSTGLSGSATNVTLLEYTPSGSLVQSIALPTTDSGSNQMLTATGSSTSEGALSRSVDGQYLVLTGYDAAVGTTGLAGTSSSTVARVIGRVAADGTIDTSTTTTAFRTTGQNSKIAYSVRHPFRSGFRPCN